jgi:spermidine synthase
MTASGLFLLTVILSAAGIGTELLLMRECSVLISQTVEASALALGCYLGALGVGAMACGKLRERSARPTLAAVECALCLAPFLALLAIDAGYVLCKIGFYFPEGDLIQAASSARHLVLAWALAVVAAVGFLTGFELPLLIRWHRQLTGRPAAGRILGASYLGALAGSFLLALALLPRLDPLKVAIALSLVNAVVAIFLTLGLERRWRLALQGALLAALAILLLGARSTEDLRQLLAKVKHSPGLRLRDWSRAPEFLASVAASEPDIRRIQTRYQLVELVPRRSGITELYLDGHVQISPGWSDAYHESLAHIPVQIAAAVPARVLVLGGGDGCLARELLKYGDRVRRITLVEIDPTMLQLARTDPWFLSQNQGALSHPKVEARAEDALRFLRSSAETFDAIYADFPLPHDFDALKLYSAELYRAAAARLSPSGYLALDAGMHFQGEPPGEHPRLERWNSILLSTLRGAGFQEVRPFLGSEGFAFARPKPGLEPAGFVDHGIELKTLDAGSLSRALRHPIRFTLDPALVNSIFKPKLASLPEVRF